VPPEDDPPPAPPVRPDAQDCCGGGCDPCIFDIYQDELDRYHAELRAWEARVNTRNSGSGPSGAQ